MTKVVVVETAPGQIIDAEVGGGKKANLLKYEGYAGDLKKRGKAVEKMLGTSPARKGQKRAHHPTPKRSLSTERGLESV